MTCSCSPLQWFCMFGCTAYSIRSFWAGTIRLCLEGLVYKFFTLQVLVSILSQTNLFLFFSETCLRTTSQQFRPWTWVTWENLRQCKSFIFFSILRLTVLSSPLKQLLFLSPVSVVFHTIATWDLSQRYNWNKTSSLLQ